MSLYDFYMYLKHIEFSEENLEFYIWYVLRPLPLLSNLKLDTPLFRYKNYERNYDAPGGEKDDGSFCTSDSASSAVNLAASFKTPDLRVDPEDGK